MTQFIVEIDLDGYEDEQEHDLACKEFIEESLDFSASSVSATQCPSDVYDLLKQVRPYVEDMIGIASEARIILPQIDEFLKEGK